MKKNTNSTTNDDDKLYSDLLEEIIDLAKEDGAVETESAFSEFVKDMLPQDILNALIEITGSSSFIDDIYCERFATKNDDSDDDVNDNKTNFNCQICERYVKLTRHHVYPRETHKTCLKRGIDTTELNKTISICKMCHATIHRIFSNDELSKNFFSLELLLGEERVIKYAKWASSQGSRLSKIR
jgi:hypothetical protein